MKKTELALTKETIAKEGIEIKLTQGDVIDALVEENMEAIRENHNDLVIQREHILKILDQEKERFIKKFVSKQDTLKDCKAVDTMWTYVQGWDHTSLPDVREHTNHKDTVMFQKRESPIALRCEVRMSVIYQTNINSIKFTGESEYVTCHFTYSNKTIDLIKRYNKNVDAFMAMIPEKGLNPKEITKKIKNQFTKEILKSTSPDFKDKLFKTFGISV